MPSSPIGSAPSEIFSNTQDFSVIQNTGTATIYIGQDSTVSATPQFNFIVPNASFRWPPHTPLWCVTALGQISTLAYISNGAEIGQASTAQSLTAPQYLLAPAPNTVYISNYPQSTGIYQVTCPSTTVTTIIFLDAGGNVLASGQTVGGSLTIAVPGNAASVEYYTSSGVNITITLQLTGFTLPSSPYYFIMDISALDGANTLQ